jgi:hypothetical protein
MTAIIFAALGSARTAIAKAALLAEERADDYQRMGRSVSVDQARREADSLWYSAFVHIGNEGDRWSWRRATV